MDFSESLSLELHYKNTQSVFIKEGNLKTRKINRNLKIGKSFQYTFQHLSHRFITWCIDNNTVTITEYSTDYDLLGNRIKIEFEKSQILSLNIFENDQTVEFLFSTSLLAMRFSLHHPSKLRQPNKESHQYSIFYGITDLNEIKHSISQYFEITNVTAASSMIDFTTNDAYFNYALSNGSIFTVVMASSINIEDVRSFEMRETSLLSKIFSGFMPNRQRTIEYADKSILDMTYIEVVNVVHLVTISRDNKLRIWNLKDRTCTISDDLLGCVLESNGSNRSLSTINQNSIISSHKIKSFFTNTNINDYIDTVVVYFHTIIGKDIFSNWVVLRVMDSNDRANYNQPIQICSNINHAGDNLNLLDFEIGYDMKTNDIIGVWSLTSQCNEEDGNMTHSLIWAPLIEKKDTKMTCRLYNATNELELSVLDHQDPQEVIMAKLFSPHRFSRMAVINILNRYSDGEEFLSPNTNIDELKYRLALVVEVKVEKKAAIHLSEGSDIDMIELNRQQWYNIFQEMVEEHFIVMEPLGIISASGTIGLNRFGTVSLMRNANIMENILSGASNEHLQSFFDENSLLSGYALLKCIHDLSITLQSFESWPMIEHRVINMGENPVEICRQLSLSSFDISSLGSRFENQPHLLKQAVDLLEKCDIDCFQEMISDMESCRLSSLSMGMLHYSICQVVRDRICSALVLMTMLTPRSLSSLHGSHLTELVDRIICLIKSLVSVYWLLTIRQNTSLELTDVQKTQLTSLNLMENRCDDDSTDILCLRVLQLLQYKFKVNNIESHTWQSKMSKEMAMIVNYLYPTGDSFPLVHICKYFFSYNMPLKLLDYLKMISQSEPKGWWDGDECLVDFMIGLAYLLLNKPWRSIEYFMSSIRKPELSSSSLPDIVLDDNTRSYIDSLSVLQAELFIKIIDVMGNINNPQPFIITMAEAGIEAMSHSLNSNENVIKYKSILMTILFKNLLEIKKYEEARRAIIDNPDVEKQKDCLRQFIMVLCDHRQLEKLVNFNYEHLNEEFINIVSSRARVSDLSNSNDPFYNVLYAYHIRRSDLKSAATCQLDLALQLDNDMKNHGPYMENSVAILKLQNQMKAYLTCIDVSSLLPSEEQLFVFPATLTEDFVDKRFQPFNSTTHQQQTEQCQPNEQEMELGDETSNKEGTERNIIDLNQIRRQYNLIKSRLKLLRESPEHGFIQSGKLNPALTMANLLQIGLYSDAIKICFDFKLDMASIIGTIATRCAQVNKNCLDRPLLKEKENVIDSLEEITENVDFASFGSLQKLMWQLLAEVLKKYDNSARGDLYIKACSKLLSSGIEQLPSWLIDATVMKNGHSSLLRLYISNGLVESAVTLSCRIMTERIDEIQTLKERCEFSGFKSFHKVQISWISYPVILHLLDILASMKEDQHMAKDLFEQLNDKFKTMTNILQIDSVTRAIGSI